MPGPLTMVVCIKRVPDSTARIQAGADGKSINPQGVEFIINPYDEYAIEEALRLKEKYGGETIGLSLDPDGSETILRKALAMGLDRAILIKGGAPFDGLATARMLAGVLKTVKFDLLLCGKQAIDDDSLQVPSMVAHLLGIPRANVVTKLEMLDGRVSCRRQVEGGEETVEMALPCLIAAQKGLNEPRFPSLKGIMAAKKKTIEVKEAPAPERTMEVLGLELPPPRPPGKIVGQGKEAVPQLVRLLREEAKVL